MNYELGTWNFGTYMEPKTRIRDKKFGRMIEFFLKDLRNVCKDVKIIQ
jgi:hypothetical protein